MKSKLFNMTKSAAPLVLMLAFTAVMHAQGINEGLNRTTQTGLTILSWLRNIAIVGFMITFVWGCLECAFESWRDGRGRIFCSIACAIAAGVVQGLISGFYSTTT